MSKDSPGSIKWIYVSYITLTEMDNERVVSRYMYDVASDDGRCVRT
jgi:hypothetical protein